MADIIKRPVLTEKATKLSEKRQYVFEVDPNANKIEIAKAIKEIFLVDPISVRTVRVKGKNKVRMTRRGLLRGKTNLKKKAYITLKEGQSIDIVAGTGNAE